MQTPLKITVIWQPTLGEAGDKLHARCEGLLSATERARRDVFGSEKRRREFTLGRGFLRAELGRQLGVDPRVLVLGESEQGKPLLLASGPGAGVAFNLSHCEGLVACAIVDPVAQMGGYPDVSIGIDVEKVRSRPSMPELAGEVFCEAELHEFRALSGPGMARRFFEYWTLKEAYVKATGVGLATGLSSLSVDLSNPERIHIRETQINNYKNAEESWAFSLTRLAPDWQLAVAVRGATADQVNWNIQGRVFE